MIVKFMSELKRKVGQNLFKEIMKMAEEDIKFNRVSFGKRTTPNEFMTICNSCYFLLTKCEVIEG